MGIFSIVIIVLLSLYLCFSIGFELGQKHGYKKGIIYGTKVTMDLYKKILSRYKKRGETYRK